MAPTGAHATSKTPISTRLGWRAPAPMNSDRAEIDQRGIDDFAAREAGHGVGRTAAQADIVHRDYGAVRSAQDIAGCEDCHAIGAEHLKVSPGAEDFALEPRPAHASAEDRNDPPQSLGRFADDDRLGDLDREVGNV